MDKTIFFDLETGGVIPGKHPIIQFAGISVRADLSEEFEAFEVKIEFDERDCDPRALEINSYDRETWKAEAVPPEVAVKRIAGFLAGHATINKRGKNPPHKPYSIAQTAGHNISTFDIPHLQRLFKKHGAFLPIAFLGYDTLPLAIWLKSWGFFRASNVKLETLAKKAGHEFDAHDALEDVRANVAVARWLRDMVDPKQKGLF